MNTEGTRRVMETDCHETANQYLRFGWNLINQYVVEATSESPTKVRYVLASVRRLEDTRQVAIVADPDEVNQYLNLGWKLIDKQIANADPSGGRQETLQFVLAWQTDDPPMRPGDRAAVTRSFSVSEDDDEL